MTHFFKILFILTFFFQFSNPIKSMFVFCAGILVMLPIVDSCWRSKTKKKEKKERKSERKCPSINFADLASAAGGGALFR